MTEFDEKYWTNRWKTEDTGWDLGAPSTPMENYIRQLRNKKTKILIPGAGNAYEGLLLHELGFSNTFILDISPEPLREIAAKHKEIPSSRLLLDDFFKLNDTFDLILEQTFFCAIDPSLRREYFEKCHSLLNPGRKLAGVLFNDAFNADHPPFGGYANEYKPLFEDLFTVHVYEPCYNSIKPRMGREWFMILIKKETTR
ncbi:MAG: SAM-dependent methyltransferase [Flavobacteriales bacterium]